MEEGHLVCWSGAVIQRLPPRNIQDLREFVDMDHATHQFFRSLFAISITKLLLFVNVDRW